MTATSIGDGHMDSTVRAAAAAWAGLVAAYLVVLAWPSVDARLVAVVDNLGELAAAGFASACAALAARRARRAGEPWSGWGWLAAATGAWALGQALWTVLELASDLEISFPGPADVGFLAFPVLATIALLRWPGPARSGPRMRSSLTDALVVATSLLLLSWTVVLSQVWAHGEGGAPAVLVGMAYPVGDVVLVTLALLLLIRGGAQRPLLLLVAGLTALVIADSAFVYAWANGTYAAGNISSVAWVAGFALLGLAGLSGNRERHQTAVSRPVPAIVLAALPYLPLLVVGGLFLASVLQGRVMSRPQAVLAVVLFALVIARQVRALADNRGLLTTLRHRESELRQLAGYDPLTGLPNRSLFRAQVELALSTPNSPGSGGDGGRRSSVASRSAAVLFCDLDGFKAVNDSHGHQSGDELLVAVTRRLSSCMRAGDVVSRLGGDEFAILLPHADQAAALAVADRLVTVVAEAFVLRDHVAHVGVSVGVVIADGAGGSGGTADDVDRLLRNADIAMYEAKAAGRGRFMLFGPEMLESHLDRATLTQDLHGAVERGEFFVEYQPVVTLRTGEIDGFEALARWAHPVRGLIPPSTFVPLAESAGLIREIGRFVHGEAMRAASRFAAVAGRPLSIAVNVSARQLDDEELLDRISAGAPDGVQVIVEVTESTLVQHNAMAALEMLRARGVRIAMDDFGVGQSSISTLRLMPIDIIKLDRSFTVDITTDPRAAGIVRAVATMTDELGLALVAEGIETLDQLECLRRLGCQLGQGYHIARPRSPERTRAALAEASLLPA
jgi:diguanylate cyclase (GGDEF)-like protein